MPQSGTFPKLNRFPQFHDIHGQVDDESATGANCICRDALEYIQRGWLAFWTQFVLDLLMAVAIAVQVVSVVA